MASFAGIQGQTWLTLFGWAFILIGCIFIYVTVQSVRGHIKSRDWPRASAVLKSAEIVKRVREGDSDDHYRKYVTWFCGVNYEYAVGGQTYSASDRIEAEGSAGAAEMVARQKIGDVRFIYYNPDEPEQHRFTLASPIKGLLWLLPFFGFAGFGWAVILVARIV